MLFLHCLVVVGETVAGMSEGPEKDVGRYLRWLGRTSGPIGFCYHILYGEHSTPNTEPLARIVRCWGFRGRAQPKFSVQWKSASVIKAVLKSQSVNPIFGKMFVFLGFSVQFSARKAVSLSSLTLVTGGDNDGSFSPGWLQDRFLPNYKAQLSPHS